MAESFFKVMLYTCIYSVLCLIIYLFFPIVIGMITRDQEEYYSLATNMAYALTAGPISCYVGIVVLDRIHKTLEI